VSHGLLHASLISAVTAATPILYASLGELVGEKVGVMNIGIEGVMLMGAVAGFAIAFHTGDLGLSLLGGLAAGAAFSAVMVGIPSVLLGAPQILAGFGAWFIGLGLSSQLGTSFLGESLSVQPAQIDIPLLDRIPFFGDIFFQQPWTVYLAVVLAVAISLLFSRTRHGLNLRAVGEDPASAFVAGVPVRRIQMIYVAVGGGLMGLGGAVFSVAIAGGFQEGMTAGRGFIAFALVIFVGWRPLALVAAAYLFGILLILVDVGQSQGWNISSDFLAMAPYLLTVLALAVRAAHEMRRSTRPAAPAALGTVFVRGEK
jgi:simple sugar transport system permease protein